MSLFHRLRPFLTLKERQRIADAIARAEGGTSGEIHVHLTSLSAPSGILGQAEKTFFTLGLDKTTRRNGVLILIATGDRRFAIWGDQGIHQKAGQPLWDKARRVLEDGLRAGKRGEAVEACVAEVGRALAEHFPADGPRANELPDDVTGD